MKGLKILIYTIGVLVLTSCSNLQAPIYQGVENVNVSGIVNDSVVIHADLNFENPNKIGGQLMLHDLKAEVNKIELGNLYDKEVKVPAKSSFSVPLDLKLSYGQIFDSKEGLLSTLLKSITTNKVEVKFEGIATFKKFIVKKDYPIQYSKTIKILK